MGYHTASSTRSWEATRFSTWSLGAGGFAAALAALSLPAAGVAPQLPEIAAILAFGALALLAGHRWAVAVAATASVLQIGIMWPVLIDASLSAGGRALAAAAIAGAIPGLLAFPRAAPMLVDLITRRRAPRLRAASVPAGRALTTLWLAAPAVSIAIG